MSTPTMDKLIDEGMAKDWERQKSLKAAENQRLAAQKAALLAALGEDLFAEIGQMRIETLENPQYGKSYIQWAFDFSSLEMAPFKMWCHNGDPGYVYVQGKGLESTDIRKGMAEVLYTLKANYWEWIREKNAEEITQAQNTLKSEIRFFGRSMEELEAAAEILRKYYPGEANQVKIDDLLSEAAGKLAEKQFNAEVATKAREAKDKAREEAEAAQAARLETFRKVVIERCELIYTLLAPARAQFLEMKKVYNYPVILSRIRYASFHYNESSAEPYFEDWIDTPEPDSEGYFTVIRDGQFNKMAFPNVISIEKEIKVYPAEDFTRHLSGSVHCNIFDEYIQFYAPATDREDLSLTVNVKIFPWDEIPDPLAIPPGINPYDVEAMIRENQGDRYFIDPSLIVLPEGAVSPIPERP